MSDMPDLNQLLNQAMKMQEQMAAAQQQAAQTTVEGVSGGGVVRVHMSAGGEFHSVAIDPKVVDPGDVSLLEDLLLAALRDAVAQASAVSQEMSSQAMGGMDLNSLGLGGFGASSASVGAGGNENANGSFNMDSFDMEAIKDASTKPGPN
jgi:nucleoid-associated protein EbfC